ncbi:MAG: thioredoxin [Candidatus Latescibacterota bacterium]|nr:MAG: thioredoxin [Candidatus Latescibacterota bacterium]
MTKPLSITDEQFEQEVIRSDTPVVVDFWAPWCAPCRMIAPTLESLSKEMDGKVRFVKINVDENPVQASKFGVQGIPTLLFFRGGELIDTAVGAYPEPMLREKLGEVFGSGDAN